MNCLGFHLNFDERLTLASDVDGNPKYSWENVDISSVKSSGNTVFFTSASGYLSSADNSITLYFLIPEDAEIGDSYALNLVYESGDLFTTCGNYENDKLEQAYLFTQGLNSGSVTIEDADAVTELSMGINPERYPVSGFRHYYSFTAPYDGTFSFETISDFDTYGTIYDSLPDGNYLSSNDDGGLGTNFRIVRELSKGETV